MADVSNEKAIARCSCAGVELELAGVPITSIVCYCDDCQEGSHQIELLARTQSILGPDGGTAYVLYRKDRVNCSKGSAFLKAYKIMESSATNRVVATCCNSGMFVSFDDGKPWVSVYRARMQGDVPPLRMRIFTKFKPKGSAIPNDVPSYSTFPARFVAKIVAAKIAMLLRL